MVFFKKRSPTSKPRPRFVRKKTTAAPKPSLPRFRPSRKTYWKNRTIAKRSVQFSESKLLSLDSFTQEKPSEVSPGSNGFKWNTVLGSGQPATWTGFIDQSLGGINFQQGFGNSQRVGSYMYLRHSTIFYKIEMDSGVNDPFPIQFRMIIGKVRRSAIPAGEGVSPGDTLFLNTNGVAAGTNDPTFDSYSTMLQPLNKKSFTIMSDKRFTLQAATTVQSGAVIPGQETYIQVASKYPFFKQMRITLPHRVKAHYGATAPNDYDYRWFIALYSHGLTNNTPASQWTVTTRGTTSALDN